MRLVLVFVMIAMVGCVAGEPARRHRWPGHRQEKDQQIEDLLQRVAKLEKELAETRAYVSNLHVNKRAPDDAPTDGGPAPSDTSPPPAPKPAPAGPTTKSGAPIAPQVTP